MEKHISFDQSGARALALVILSCYPVHRELNFQAMAYLKKVIAGECELDCEVLLGKLPVLQGSIVEFARQLGYEEISAENVAEFFAGKMHYEKILADFREYKLLIRLNSVFSLRTIFAHLALPLEIVGSEEDGFVGRYSKGQFEFLVKGLVASKYDSEIIKRMLLQKAEIVVLTHFAAVIVVNPPRKIVVEILEMQQQAKLFFTACKYLQKHGGVDYNVFPRNCRSKTAKILESIDI